MRSLAPLFALALFASAAQAEDVTKTFDAPGIKRLVLDNGAGTVTITGSDAAKATVVAHKIHFDEGCSLAIDLNGDELTATSKDADKGFTKKCEVQFELTVPRHLTSKLRIGAGDVSIDGLAGVLAIELGSGDLKIKNSDFKVLDGKSGSGNVSIDGAIADAQLKIGAGNADVKLAKSSNKSKLDLKVGTGKATINLPKEAKVKSSFKSGLGSLTNEFDNSPDAAFTISGAAGAGDMEIKKF